MALNFLPTTNYSDLPTAWAAIIGAANFWEEVTETTATVGDITLTLGSGSISIDGYGLTASVTVMGANNIMIAADENGLCFTFFASGSSRGCLALAKNDSGEWCCVTTTATTSGNNIIAPDTTAVALAVRPEISSARLTAIIPTIGTYSTFVSDRIFYVISSDNAAYDGKIELNNQKYVKAFKLAMAYTE